MANLNSMWVKSTGLCWDVEGMIASAQTAEEKAKLFDRLNWHIGLLKSTATKQGKYDDSANGESDLLDELRAKLAMEIVADEDELQASIADGGDITLTKSVEITKALVIEADTTINLNGNSIVNSKVDDGYSIGLKAQKGNVVIEGAGEIKTTAETKDDYSMAVWARGAQVKIMDGRFENQGDSTDLIYASGGGNVEIYGGEFKAAGPAEVGDGNGTENPYVALNVRDADYKSGASKIICYGGKFFNFNPANNLSEGKNTNFVAEGYTVMVDGVENLEPWKIGMPDMWFEVVKKPEVPAEPEVEAGGEMEEGEEN